MDKDKNKNNQKPKRSRKPKSTSTTPEPTDNSLENAAPKIIKMDLTHLLENFLVDPLMQEKIAKEATKRLDAENSVTMVKSFLSEYFSSFILMGYDIDGERMVIKMTKSDRDEDSIIELIRYVMIRILNEDG